MPSPAELLAKKLKSKASKRRPIKKVWNCRLREMRLALGLRQSAVSAAVGLSPTGYHQAENDGRDVMLTTAVKLSEFFGKPIQEIWPPPSESDAHAGQTQA